MNRTSLVAFLALIALPAPAFAHAHLQGAQPASGATVRAAPSQLVLTFSEAPALAMSALRLFGPDSTPVTLGAVTHDAGVRTLTASIIGPLVAGRYTVEWQTAGDDGHVQHGSYQFVIAEGATGLAPAATAASSSVGDSTTSPESNGLDSAVAPRNHPGFDASSPIYVLVRWVQFAALLLVIGAVAFRWLVLPRAGAGLSEPARLAVMLGAARAGSFAAWLLAAAALARLAAQAATLHGVGYMADSAVIVPMLTSTIWGHGWIMQVVAAVVAIVGFHRARRDATSTPAWSVAALAAVALAVVPALSGHAVATPGQTPIAVTADTFHVLGAGAWLGTLAVMLVAGLPIMARESAEGRTGTLSRMVNAFSPLALGCAAVVVFTGVIAARQHLGSWDAFTTTSYGRTLLIKLAVVVLLVCVAAYNWRRVRPSLVLGANGDVERIRRSASAEVLLALLIVLVTAVLVALPTPMDVVG
jgi:putative copper export protein/methionine-rich copper-binding protein CopC